MYRYFFNVSLDDRFTYFKDDFMYVDNIRFYNRLIKQYNKGIIKKDTNVFFKDISHHKFPQMKYDSLKINNNEFRIRPEKSNPEYIKGNIENLENIISYCKRNGYEVIINDTPLTSLYKDKMLTKILYRRDSILSIITSKYKIRFFDPSDSLKFNLKDFKDYNHLSPVGAKKYTKALEEFMKNKI